MADELHLAQIRAVDDGATAAPERTVHAVAPDHRRTVYGDGIVGRARIVTFSFAVHLLPRQSPDADDVGLERISDVQRPDHALVPAIRIVGQESERAPIVDTEAMRSAARHVVEADLLRRIRLGDVEDIEPGACIHALLARQAFGIDVKNVISDNTQLVTVNTGGRAEFVDFLWLLRIAHVMGSEAFRGISARCSDRSDIRIALVHLHQAPATPGGGGVMAEQAEAFVFLGVMLGHGRVLLLTQLLRSHLLASPTSLHESTPSRTPAKERAPRICDHFMMLEELNTLPRWRTEISKPHNQSTDIAPDPTVHATHTSLLHPGSLTYVRATRQAFFNAGNGERG